MRAALGRGEKGRRMGRDVVEDSEAGAAHTWDREAVRQPGDDGKMAVAEELGGGGAQAQRGEEDSRDGCGKDRVRASASYRGWREVEVARIGRAAVVNSVLTRVVTGVRGGGNAANDELDRSGLLHGAGGGWRGGARGGGIAQPEQAKEEEGGRQGWVGQMAEWAGWLLGRLGRKLEKNPFRIKIGFLNLLRLWKFAQGDLGGILAQGFFPKFF
jgi:hypothetical protein